MSVNLAPFDEGALDRDDATICALDADLRIIYVNEAWRTWSRDQGAPWGEGRWTLGVSLLETVPEDLRPFYEELFERARAGRSPVEHAYECSTPTTFRRFRMRIFRCGDDALLVAHSLSHERSHDRSANPAIERLYRDANGIVSLCSHCRRVKRHDGDVRWDWVPDYVVKMPPNTSHVLCPLCTEYHYADRNDADAPAPSSRRSSTPSIVVAESDPSMLALVGRVLRRASFRVKEAVNTDELLRSIEADPYDLVLLGTTAPGMEHTGTMVALRALQPSVPLLVMSGVPPTGQVAGAVGYVQTPFTPRALVEEIRVALALADV
jgi:CheY-like chemotaxis protein